MGIALRSVGTIQALSGTSDSTPAPSGLSDDDLMLWWATVNTGVNISNDEGGWTEQSHIKDQAGGDDRTLMTTIKVADSESGGYDWSHDYGSSKRMLSNMAAFTGVDPSTPIDATATTSESDGDSHTAAAITTNTDGAMVVIILYALDTTGSTVPSTIPSGYTLLVEDDDGVGAGFMAACYKIVASAGTETPGAWTSLDAGSGHCSTTIALKPAQGKVWVNDAATWDAGAVEQDYPGEANWSDTSINMQEPIDTTGLSGQLYVIVENALGGMASRAITVQAGANLTDIELVDLDDAAQASLTSLNWDWFDEDDPKDFTAPTDQGTAETTDGSGKLTLAMPNSTLTSGETGCLVLHDTSNNLIGIWSQEVD